MTDEFLPEGHVPDGHLPTGHLPGLEGDAPTTLLGRLKFPTDVKIIALDVADAVAITFDWSEDIVAGVTLSSVVYEVPDTLAQGVAELDATNSLSSVVISGGAHGGRYTVRARATLSTQEVISKAAPVLGFRA